MASERPWFRLSNDRALLRVSKDFFAILTLPVRISQLKDYIATK
jgi:hypothetical protein